ncbi:AN1 family Zinc finger domain-containing [Micractinium conductrix]|uniref:AN1 family Zinc finger domain-containing n=1 Tax=Micractinium conductrix TaxID=554055 RepID=A0A2P6V6T0_9CHLO|nr:AN1 family Zinc finger domain-containing [Micractinium conductrix]|eukprot:PSC69790.1 AN1 family Zinc finger domain-containing [Micractinium conductrix]
MCHKAQQSAALAAATQPSPKPVPQPSPAPVAAAALVPAAGEPASAVPEATTAAASLDAPAEAPVAAEAAPPGDDKPVQENRSRCFCCRKKVGLLGFECRCGYVFCSGHRHANDHSCTYDFASMDKANLAKANNKVVAAKIDKL